MNQPMQLPAHLQDLSSRGLAARAITMVGTTLPPHISIQGNTYTLIDASNIETPLGATMQACIVDVSDVKCKKYFPTKWTPESNDAPICWSANGVTPSREAQTPQARTCAECEWNKRGSKVSEISGAAIKACRDEVWLALLLPQFPEMLFQLVITPGSFNTWGAYLEKFKATPGIDTFHILTQFSFVPKTNGVIDFQAVSYINEATAIGVKKAVASKAADAFVGRNDAPRELAAPAAQPALAAPQAEVVQPAQVQQPAPFVPAPAPNAASPTTPVFASTATQNTATNATASPSEPQRRRRRTAAEMQAAQTPQNGAAPAAQPQQAPFMPGAAAPQPNFGIQAGAAPNPELAATLDNLFGPKK